MSGPTTQEGQDMPEASRTKGIVKWFNAEKGYGFIAPDGGGRDLFVHFKQIRQTEKGQYRTLDDSARVSFIVGEGTKGPVANDVVVEV